MVWYGMVWYGTVWYGMVSTNTQTVESDPAVVHEDWLVGCGVPANDGIPAWNCIDSSSQTNTRVLLCCVSPQDLTYITRACR